MDKQSARERLREALRTDTSLRTPHLISLIVAAEVDDEFQREMDEIREARAAREKTERRQRRRRRVERLLRF